MVQWVYANPRKTINSINDVKMSKKVILLSIENPLFRATEPYARESMVLYPVKHCSAEKIILLKTSMKNINRCWNHNRS